MDDHSAVGLADALNHLGRDPSADNWRRVVEGAWPLVAGPCYRIADRRGDDAIQEALLHVRAGARTFRPRGTDADGDARRWLRRVATTSALSVLRTDRRSQTRARQAAPPSSAPAPDQAAALADDLALMRAELAGLREPDRTAVALHHLQGQDFDSVGRALGCTPEAARKRIERALATLRSRLAGRGVALGLAAIATALRDAPAATAPATPSVTALELIGSPLAPTTSITLASGVALMATTAGCASAVLATVLAWNYATGTDQTLAPPAPPGKPPVVAPVQPAEVHWLNMPFPPQESPTTLGKAAGHIELLTGHPVYAQVEWKDVVRGQGEPFPLAGLTPSAALDRLTAATGMAWLLIEGQIMVSSTSTIALLQSQVSPPAAHLSGQAQLDALRQQQFDALRKQQPFLKLFIAPNLVQEGAPPAAVAWDGPVSITQVLGLLAGANHWRCVWQHDERGFLLLREPIERPLLDVRPHRLIIRGRPWTPPSRSPLLDKGITCAFTNAPSRLVLAEMSRQIGIPITWDADEQRLSIEARNDPAFDVLTAIAQASGTTLTEPEIGKRLAFAINKH